MPGPHYYKRLARLATCLAACIAGIPRRNPDFVNHGALLDRIRKKCAAPASRIALVGLGGVG